MLNTKILFIEICNYEDYPIGGHLSFAKQMMTAFGPQLYLVGTSTDDTKIGEWTKRKINNITYNYFSVKKIAKKSKKPVIPERLKSFFLLRKYRKKIFSCGIVNVFIQTPEILFAINKIYTYNICYRIAGLENPLSISRYWYAKYFAGIFDNLFFYKLKNVNQILATGNLQAIKDYYNRCKGLIAEDRIEHFPTFYNSKIFQINKFVGGECKMNIRLNEFIIVTTGRLSKLKGWEFLIKSFIEFIKILPNSKLYFLGDGEDKYKIIEYIQKNSVKDVYIIGRLSQEEIAQYLNLSNLYIMGSYFEGWSTSLVEAVACGKPIVTTNFSSAKELVEEGVNGYVIENHNVDKFVEAMLKIKNISQENLHKKAEEIKKYSLINLKTMLLDIWELK